LFAAIWYDFATVGGGTARQWHDAATTSSQIVDVTLVTVAFELPAYTKSIPSALYYDYAEMETANRQSWTARFCHLQCPREVQNIHQARTGVDERSADKLTGGIVTITLP